MEHQKLIEFYNSLPEEEKKSFQKSINLVQLSNKFERTDISVSIEAKKEKKTQKDLYQILKDSDFFKGHLSTEIIRFEFDNNPKSYDCEAVCGVIDKFSLRISHSNIIFESMLTQSYLRVNLYQAVLLSIELIKAGVLKENNRSIFIHLKETRLYFPCKLVVWRGDDGYLKIRIMVINPDNHCNVDNYVLSKKN